jgi:DNA-binding NarL/FixJ family response regulator
MEREGSAGEARIRVLVADNTLIYTQLLADALKRDSGLDVNASPWDSRGLIKAVNSQPFHVLIISSNLDEEPLRGLETLRELRSFQPGLRAVMLLDSSKRETIIEAFRAGARGIFTRNQSVEVLAKCVRCVHHGQIWADSQQMSFAVEALATAPAVRAVDAKGFNLLSTREMEVVKSLAEGLTNREIAERLQLSQHTVKNYLFRIFDKLGVSSRVELLFMTLSQAGAPQLASQSAGSGNVSQVLHEAEFAVCQRAALEGMPGAQLRLAEMYADGREIPVDLPASYMWYMVCEQTNQAMREGIAVAKRKLANALTTEEILAAQSQAQERLEQIAKKGVGRNTHKATETSPGVTRKRYA